MQECAVFIAHFIARAGLGAWGLHQGLNNHSLSQNLTYRLVGNVIRKTPYLALVLFISYLFIRHKSHQNLSFVFFLGKVSKPALACLAPFSPSFSFWWWLLWGYLNIRFRLEGSTHSLICQKTVFLWWRSREKLQVTVLPHAISYNTLLKAIRNMCSLLLLLLARYYKKKMS